MTLSPKMHIYLVLAIRGIFFRNTNLSLLPNFYCHFYPIIDDCHPVQFQKNLRKIFRKSSKMLIWDETRPNYPTLGETRTFLQKKASSLFSVY